MINWLEKRSHISWSITILMAIFIFYMSSRTFKAGGGKGYLSYLYHFLIFFLLAFFLFISIIRGDLKNNIFVITILLAILYGISDEIHQYFVPGRYPSIVDVITNSVGIFFAGILYSLICRNNVNKRKY